MQSENVSMCTSSTGRQCSFSKLALPSDLVLDRHAHLVALSSF